MIKKIISDGQTGADRAALDVARNLDIPHGGWCPRGRIAEDEIIDSLYGLVETPNADSVQRTEWNVRDSDATVIFSISAKLIGGSAKTEQFTRQQGKPCLHISREQASERAGEILAQFLAEGRAEILNVAGPRHSEEADVARFVFEVLEPVLDARQRNPAQSANACRSSNQPLD
jgi:putative molybdenum carrier protein